MKTFTWSIGSARVTQMVELEAGEIIEEAVPQATPEEIRKIGWLVPNYATVEGRLKALVQGFLIETDGKILVVDTCVGSDKVRTDMPAWSGLQTDFLKRLAERGVSPADVDVVTCTHLHVDHVGWNTTRVGDRWVPTFPNARYLFSRAEYAYWQSSPSAEIADDLAGFADSVRPIVEAGLAELVEDNHQLTGSVRLVPSPGHTPHHVSVRVQSESDVALISGDFLHHPCQVARPDWGSIADFDKQQAIQTRRSILARLEQERTLLLGSHFHHPSGGRVVSGPEGLEFQPEPPGEGA